MGYNQLCGIGRDGDGTYTTEGITELCARLRGSAVTSLECAAAPRVAPALLSGSALAPTPPPPLLSA